MGEKRKAEDEEKKKEKKEKSEKKERKERKEKKEKSEKKDKKDKKDKKETKSVSPEPTEKQDKLEKAADKPKAWNDWTKSNFDGDADRKNKFLRLLGGKKPENQSLTSTNNQSAITQEKQVNKQLEKEFESAHSTHHQLKKRKVGLGFQ
ncbi:hypothetical protein HDV01_004998 [Terramyces sp. JEL0728]|nr:hypothetical protein HDV01_004998 [Terramyces sp. JEL0728]